MSFLGSSPTVGRPTRRMRESCLAEVSSRPTAPAKLQSYPRQTCLILLTCGKRRQATFPFHETRDSGHEIRFSVWTLSSEDFDLDGRTVGQDFGHAGRDLVCIVAHADNRVGADLGGMLNHQVVRVRAGSFAKLGVE